MYEKKIQKTATFCRARELLLYCQLRNTNSPSHLEGYLGILNIPKYLFIFIFLIQ
jgi:hypothetical protein